MQPSQAKKVPEPRPSSSSEPAQARGGRQPAPPCTLRVNGQPFVHQKHPPCILAAAAKIASLPPDEIFDARTMTEQFHIATRTLDSLIPAFPHLTHKFKSRRYFGSVAAIEEFKRQTA